jgi:copper(I)-binding protein
MLLALLAVVAFPVYGQIQIENPWSRATPGGTKIAAGYMVVKNNSATADHLVSASSPNAGRVETHVHIREGDVMRMREVKGYDIPAHGSFELKPGGAHLMLINIKAPFKAGDRVPVTLRFQRAGEVKIELAVGNGPPARADDHSQHKH